MAQPIDIKQGRRLFLQKEIRFISDIRPLFGTVFQRKSAFSFRCSATNCVLNVNTNRILFDISLQDIQNICILLQK